MGPQYQPREKPVQKKEAKELLENYVQSMQNPYLKPGKIEERDTYFEGEILTEDNDLVDKVIIEKDTGWMSSAWRDPGTRGRGWGYGYGMGPGMMGPGHMMGRGYRGYGPRYQGLQEPLKEKDVKSMMEDYVQSTRNPNLKVGDIAGKEAYFEVEILTQDDSLVDKILVDKNTGWMRSLY
jgi:hypothetical protein